MESFSFASAMIAFLEIWIFLDDRYLLNSILYSKLQGGRFAYFDYEGIVQLVLLLGPVLQNVMVLEYADPFQEPVKFNETFAGYIESSSILSCRSALFHSAFESYPSDRFPNHCSLGVGTGVEQLGNLWKSQTLRDQARVCIEGYGVGIYALF
jgi:hypothetical protein